MPPKTPPPTAHTAAPGGPATLLPTAIPCCAPPTILCAWAHSGNASAPARMPAIKVLLCIRPPDFLCERSASQSRAAQERLERGHCVFIEGLVPGSTKSVPGSCSVHEPKCSAANRCLAVCPKAQQSPGRQQTAAANLDFAEFTLGLAEGKTRAPDPATRFASALTACGRLLLRLTVAPS